MTRSPGIVSTPARADSLCEGTARCVTFSIRLGVSNFESRYCQVFRFAQSKNESLFLQRKNPRKIAWTVLYRRMHKKGLSEEVAKKRSRKTVKHQRGIVGADLAAIAARRNQTPAARLAARQAAVTKAKDEKKDKESKKAKVRFYNFCLVRALLTLNSIAIACTTCHFFHGTKSLEAADEGWQGWRSLIYACLFRYFLCRRMIPRAPPITLHAIASL